MTAFRRRLEGLACVAFALVWALLAGCATPAGPDETAMRSAYPASRFMTATGCAQDEESALRAARVELSRMISVEVKNEFRSVTQRVTRDALSENLSVITDKSVEFTENDLVATEATKAWRDPLGSCCVLVILNRAVAGEGYVAKIESALDQSETLFASGTRRQQEGEYLVALQDYFEGLREIQKAVRMQLAGVVICPGRADQFRDMVEAPLLSQIKDRVRGLLQDVRIEKVAGDEQRGHLGYGLEEPLSVRVTAGSAGKPVKNFPLRYELVEGEARLEAEAKTDAEGRARCYVEEAMAGGEANSVVAALDLDDLAGVADLFQIPRPEVTFAYYLPTRSNVRFAVYVDDATATDAITDALSGRGFRLVEPSKVQGLAEKHKVGADAEEDRLVEAFSDLWQDVGSGNFLFIAAGTLKEGGVEGVETIHGTLHIARVPYTFKLIDASAQGKKRTIAAGMGQGKDGYTGDEKEALRRARIKAGQQMSAEMIEGLGNVFDGKQGDR